MNFKTICEKVKNGQRLSCKDGLFLLAHSDLLQLGELADHVRLRHHPQPVVTFVSDRNINYTNACVSGCRFCAFYRPLGHAEAYVIDRKTLCDKIEETIKLGGTQILLQGGMNPELGLDWYTDLLLFIKSKFDIHIHGFSPPEIFFLAEKSGLPVSIVIKRLVEAGLGSVPGGGAEILVDRVRGQISPNKCNAGQWLNVMRAVHKAGLRSSATMMFGHIESDEDIMEHLDKIRYLQDETDETHGFTAFIPWSFQPANTKIDVLPAGAVRYLKVLAASRIFLDNIENIQASWVTQGDKIAQLALAFGANDFGSTMIEENVVAAAGVTFRLNAAQICRLIKDAGYSPVQRDCFYNPVSGSHPPETKGAA
ncbi:MAG: dehypoxanthine futalosine cyclase [Deltaproteobacteria bacterium]|nr:dehypoxanthine futalosine cyclase [Deltaproteobacteria bacterium]